MWNTKRLKKKKKPIKTPLTTTIKYLMFNLNGINVPLFPLK